MTTNDLHAQVLALRRAQSASAVAKALGIPLGTVKAISSRAGLTRDNTKLREFFRLPEPTASNCTALQPPVAPPRPEAVTGDNDMCRIPDDCIDKNRYPLFMARSVLRELIESLPSTRSL